MGATVGGGMHIIRALRTSRGRTFHWGEFCVGVVSAGAVGALANLTLQGLNIKSEWRVVLVSMLGYVGGSLLDVTYHGILWGFVVFWRGMACKIYKWMHDTEECPHQLDAQDVENYLVGKERIKHIGDLEGDILCFDSGDSGSGRRVVETQDKEQKPGGAKQGGKQNPANTPERGDRH